MLLQIERFLWPILLGLLVVDWTVRSVFSGVSEPARRLGGRSMVPVADWTDPISYSV